MWDPVARTVSDRAKARKGTAAEGKACEEEIEGDHCSRAVKSKRFCLMMMIRLEERARRGRVRCAVYAHWLPLSREEELRGCVLHGPRHTGRFYRLAHLHAYLQQPQQLHQQQQQVCLSASAFNPFSRRRPSHSMRAHPLIPITGRAPSTHSAVFVPTAAADTAVTALNAMP